MFRDRKYLPLFAVLLAAILYTHSWGIFVTAGTLVSLSPPFLCHRRPAGAASRTG